MTISTVSKNWACTRKSRFVVGIAGLISIGCASEVECENLAIDDVGTNNASVSWTTSREVSSEVEFYWDDREVSLSPRSEAEATDHTHQLLGLAAGADIVYRAINIHKNNVSECTGSFETDSMPSRYPELEVTTYEPDLVDDADYVMGTIVSQPTAVYTIDRQGDLVWFMPGEDGTLTSQASRAVGSTDVIYNIFDATFEDTLATLRRQSVTGEVIEDIPAPEHHHSFVELGDGAIAYIRVDVREWYDEEEDETVDVAGDYIVERAADGTERLVFSTWDAVEPVKSDRWNAVFYVDAKDWSHGNALRYNPDSNTYLLSMGYANIVLEVDRDSGEVVRYFGEGGDYSFADGTVPFDYQHSPHYTAEGTLLMTSNVDGSLHAIEYEVDDTNKVLTQIWSHAQDEGIAALSMGHVQRMANGNTLMSFGSSALIREVTPDDEIVWEVKLANPAFAPFGDLTVFDSFYTAD